MGRRQLVGRASRKWRACQSTPLPLPLTCSARARVHLRTPCRRQRKRRRLPKCTFGADAKGKSARESRKRQGGDGRGGRVTHNPNISERLRRLGPRKAAAVASRRAGSYERKYREPTAVHGLDCTDLGEGGRAECNAV